MRRSTALLCAGALLAACSNDVDIQPIDPDGDASPTETTSDAPPADDEDVHTDEDVFAVPDDIDEAYVQAVVDELFGLRSEALRLTIDEVGAGGNPPSEALFLNDAVHEGPARAEFGEGLVEILRSTDPDDAFVPVDERSGETFEIVDLAVTQPTCIIGIGIYDRTGLLRNAETGRLSILSLIPGDDDRNPTPWRVVDQAAPLDDGEPADPDEVLSADPAVWLDFVEHGCEEGDDAA